MALEINDIAIAGFGLSVQKVIEGNFVERGGGGISRDVAADTFLNLVSADDHGQRIPSDQALDAAFHLLPAGKRGLLRRGNSVLVGSGRGERKIDAGSTTSVQRKLLQQASGAFRATPGKHIVERVEPLARLKDFHSIILRRVLSDRLSFRYRCHLHPHKWELSMIDNCAEFC